MSDLSKDTRLEMYWMMLLARRLDERAWVLHRQGKIAFHISGIGQEAAQVGAAYAIRRGEDWVAPYYRDLALLLSLGYTPREFILSLMGKREEPDSGGRQMPSHWSLRRANVISHSAPVATQCAHAVGAALAMRLRGDERVALTSCGEGATAQGEWYEAVNWAAVQRLPVVFLVENNAYAISEPVSAQMAVQRVADKAAGLGLEGLSVDGNDVFALQAAVSAAVEKARSGGGPTLIEACTYRIPPHSSDDDDRSYRTREEVEAQKEHDPLIVSRQALDREHLLTPHLLADWERKAREVIDAAVAYAEVAPYPDPQEGLRPVYAEEASND
jgi:2-oxoisovalerate dehydrogenase E1 component alpha subunit